MIFFALFLFEIILLFFLSRFLTKGLSQLFFHITKSQKAAVYGMAIIFFPGVVVHELAHLLVASVLFVRTGTIEFMPQIRGDNVKLGSVVIAKTDPVRRMFIGVAPVFVGILLLLSILYVIIQGNIINGDDVSPWIKAAGYFVSFYTLFVISNTMFSSKKDMEGTLEFVAAIGLVGLLLYILGVRIDMSSVLGVLTAEMVAFIQKADVFMSLPIVIDLGVLGMVRSRSFIT